LESTGRGLPRRAGHTASLGRRTGQAAYETASHGLIDAAVATWPVVAIVDSFELLMMIVRSAQPLVVASSPQDDASVTDPLEERAAAVFAAELAADRVPSIRAIRAAMHVGQPRAGTARVPCRSRGDARRNLVV
jgi:hypothetical protein